LMGRAHVVVGPVGAGKSTYCAALSRREHAVHLNLDAWMARLYGADPRPTEGRIAWYMERQDRSLAQLWAVASDLVELGVDVILEVGLLRRAERAAFYARVDDLGAELVVYVLDAPIEVRRERVMRRNSERGETFSVEVPPAFFELASAAWEPPDEHERAERGIVDL
jgi:predicted kinase